MADEQSEPERPRRRYCRPRPVMRCSAPTSKSRCKHSRGFSVDDASLLAEGKALAHGPGALSGLMVIDLTRFLGGPYCTMVLSDHGADVIKLEPPQGDETREWGPPFDDAGDASYFLGI